MTKKKSSTTKKPQPQIEEEIKKPATPKRISKTKKKSHRQMLEEIYETAQNVVELQDAIHHTDTLTSPEKFTLTDPRDNAILVDIIAYEAGWIKFFHYMTHLFQKSLNEKN